jgi:hypothetical protein
VTALYICNNGMTSQSALVGIDTGGIAGSIGRYYIKFR